MDQELIVGKAKNLEELLRKYAEVDAEMKMWLLMMLPLIEMALKGEIVTPVDGREIPGGYLYFEGHIQQYRDLDEALSAFKFEITGGMDPVRKRIFDGMEERRKAKSELP